MNKSKNRIFIGDWLLLKPYNNQVPGDYFYLKISNDVKQAVLSCRHLSDAEKFLADDELNLLSCFLTSYLEDLVSGSNIWNTFVKQPGNPCFNPDESLNDLLSLFMDPVCSKELTDYCIDNCRSEFPFLKESLGKVLLENLDFLLRFWKKGAYFSKPSITYKR